MLAACRVAPASHKHSASANVAPAGTTVPKTDGQHDGLRPPASRLRHVRRSLVYACTRAYGDVGKDFLRTGHRARPPHPEGCRRTRDGSGEQGGKTMGATPLDLLHTPALARTATLVWEKYTRAQAIDAFGGELDTAARRARPGRDKVAGARLHCRRHRVWKWPGSMEPTMGENYNSHVMG